MTTKIGVAVVAATGMVGQRFVERLANHPWFELRSVVASSRSQGKTYGEATKWRLPGQCPQEVAALTVESASQLQSRSDVQVVFSALPGAHTNIEQDLRRAGFAVFTNASTHRMDDDVPLLIPEVNPGALDDLRAGHGFLVANGNCSGIIATLALAPLVELGLREVLLISQQAISGAGYPGVASLDVADNLVPYIEGEEEKLETEPNKTLGTQLKIHATCTRVPVTDGHFLTVHAHVPGATRQDLETAFCQFRATSEVAQLPSAPQRPIHFTHALDRPQPRLDRDAEGGMAVTVGRLRDLGDGWFRFCVLGHNTIRGAAGQSILNAEYAVARGLLAQQ